MNTFFGPIPAIKTSTGDIDAERRYDACRGATRNTRGGCSGAESCTTSGRCREGRGAGSEPGARYDADNDGSDSKRSHSEGDARIYVAQR